jgi:hypothetical protein
LPPIRRSRQICRFRLDNIRRPFIGDIVTAAKVDAAIDDIIIDYGVISASPIDYSSSIAPCYQLKMPR